MNKAVKEFLHRGMLFGGFGPIIAGIIFAILDKTVENFSLSGTQTLIAIVSVYLLAFLQAGASVFNQIEHWSILKSLACHFSVLYLAYVTCYLVNNWIPFDIRAVLLFTAIFVVVYFAVWIIVALSVRAVSRRLNQKIG